MKNKYISSFLVCLSVFFFSFFATPTVFAQMSTEEAKLVSAEQNSVTNYQEETLEGIIIKLTGQRRITPSGNSKEQLYQQLEIQITKGSQKGKVIAMGKPQITEKGKVMPEFSVGDTVIYKKWGGNEVKIDSKEYLFVKFEDILAVVS